MKCKWSFLASENRCLLVFDSIIRNLATINRPMAAALRDRKFILFEEENKIIKIIKRINVKLKIDLHFSLV